MAPDRLYPRIDILFHLASVAGFFWPALREEPAAAALVDVPRFRPIPLVRPVRPRGIPVIRLTEAETSSDLDSLEHLLPSSSQHPWPQNSWWAAQWSQLLTEERWTKGMPRPHLLHGQRSEVVETIWPAWRSA
jgi:hypothetical protein